MTLTPNDEKQIARFRKFLRIVSEAPVDETGRVVISKQAVRYARGEDVDPS